MPQSESDMLVPWSEIDFQRHNDPPSGSFVFKPLVHEVLHTLPTRPRAISNIKKRK